MTDLHKPTAQDAYDLLEAAGVRYQIVEHEPIHSVREYDVDLPGPQVKNLLLKTRKGKEHFLVILPDEKQADLKALAAQLDCGRLSFCSEDELDELLGLPPGHITPLALPYDTERKIQVVIDAGIDQTDTVGFHPNVNTATLIMPYADFAKLLAYLAREPLVIQL